MKAKDATLHEQLKTLHPVPYYKFTVGYRDSMLGFFHIEGQGDTWEQAFEAAENRKVRERQLLDGARA